jgi:hypothetical protein
MISRALFSFDSRRRVGWNCPSDVDSPVVYTKELHLGLEVADNGGGTRLAVRGEEFGMVAALALPASQNTTTPDWASTLPD